MSKLFRNGDKYSISQNLKTDKEKDSHGQKNFISFIDRVIHDSLSLHASY